MLADLVVVFHFAFVLFVVLGGLLVLRWRWLAYVHLPVALYEALIELIGWVCPLTPLEKRLRESAGLQSYQGGFVEHYFLPVLYPAGLTRSVQLVLGMLVIGVNLAIYVIVMRKGKAVHRLTARPPAAIACTTTSLANRSRMPRPT